MFVVFISHCRLPWLLLALLSWNLLSGFVVLFSWSSTTLVSLWWSLSFRFECCSAFLYLHFGPVFWSPMSCLPYLVLIPPVLQIGIHYPPLTLIPQPPFPPKTPKTWNLTVFLPWTDPHTPAEPSIGYLGFCLSKVTYSCGSASTWGSWGLNWHHSNIWVGNLMIMGTVS